MRTCTLGRTEAGRVGSAVKMPTYHTVAARVKHFGIYRCWSEIEGPLGLTLDWVHFTRPNIYCDASSPCVEIY